MNQKGIEKPPRDWPGMPRPWWQWFQRLTNNFPKVQTFTVTLNPASVPASSTSEQTVTVNGLTTQDVVTVNKPSHSSGLGIVGARVSADNTLAITFANVTGSAIDPGSEEYRVVAIRL